MYSAYLAVPLPLFIHFLPYSSLSKSLYSFLTVYLASLSTLSLPRMPLWAGTQMNVKPQCLVLLLLNVLPFFWQLGLLDASELRQDRAETASLQARALFGLVCPTHAKAIKMGYNSTLFGLEHCEECFHSVNRNCNCNTCIICQPIGSFDALVKTCTYCIYLCSL